MMTKVDIYNSDYTRLNHSYIEIYNTYRRLSEAEDICPDDEVLDVLGKILIVFNPVLDRIKSEMTVETRLVGSVVPQQKPGRSQNSAGGAAGDKRSKGGGPVILHGNFTGE